MGEFEHVRSEYLMGEPNHLMGESNFRGPNHLRNSSANLTIGPKNFEALYVTKKE